MSSTDDIAKMTNLDAELRCLIIDAVQNNPQRYSQLIYDALSNYLDEVEPLSVAKEYKMIGRSEFVYSE